MTKSGLGFYEVNNITFDTASNSFVIIAKNEGLWLVRSPDNPVSFEFLAGSDTSLGRMQHVKRDSLGGVYFFNPSMFIHFGTASGFKDILKTGVLM